MDKLKQVFSEVTDWLHTNTLKALKGIRRFLHQKRYGLMGTLAFHMALLILLLLFKLNTRRQFIETEVILEIPQEVFEQLEQEERERQIEEEQAALEASENMEQLLKSIAVNEAIVASKVDPDENVKKMIEKIKKEVARTEELPFDEQNREGFLQDSLIMFKEKEKLLDSLQSIAYTNLGSVSYQLEGRHKVYLPIPIYKCEGKGIVVVEIMVNRSGKVVNTQILQKESVIEDNCLFETAREAARKSRFNVSLDSPFLQKGTIKYHFVQQ